MPVNLDILKTPRFWLIVAPVLLLLWTFMSLLQMLDDRKEALSSVRMAKEVDQSAALILATQQKGGSAAGSVEPFDPVDSARDCVVKVGVPEKRLTRASSASQIVQKDGAVIFRENYILTGVNLLQTAQFIDKVERNYAYVRCTQLSLTPMRGNKNTWDVNIDLEYRKP